MIDPSVPLSSIGGAIDFILHHQPAQTGGTEVGGPAQVWHLTRAHLEVSGLALAGSLCVALPIGATLGHLGRGEALAVGFGNAGRAIPEYAAIVLLAAIIGVGLRNVAIALAILGIPPILTNSYVAVRQVDRAAVDAARGMGMRGLGVLIRIELPLAAPTIIAGIRTATVNIIATATIASFVGYSDLGDFIVSRNVYGGDGVLAGAILVALLAIAAEIVLASVQRAATPRGLRLQRAASRA